MSSMNRNRTPVSRRCQVPVPASTKRDPVAALQVRCVPVVKPRLSAVRAGSRGRGQGSALTPTAQRRGLDTGTVRRILTRLAGPAVRGRVRAVLLGPVVADRLGAHDRAMTGHLHRPGNDANLDFFSPPSPSDPVHGPGERHLSAAIDHAGHHDPAGDRPSGAPALAQHRGVVPGLHRCTWEATSTSW